MKTFILEPTLSRTFLKRVQETPDQVAFYYRPQSPGADPTNKWREVSFHSFYQECRLVSFGLMGLGVGYQDKVAILSTTRYKWTLADMATLGVRAITVPLYPSSTSDDIQYILDQSEAKIVFLENHVQLQKIFDIKKQNQNALPHLKKMILFESPGAASPYAAHPDLMTVHALKELGYTQEIKTPTKFDQNLLDAQPDDCITICYTSGTTGVPKGAMLTHDNMMSVLEDCVTRLGKYTRPNSEVVVSFLPFSHILGKVESVAIYTFGWRQYFSENIDKLMVNIREVKPTILFAVPRIFEKARSAIINKTKKTNRLERGFFQTSLEKSLDYYQNYEDQKEASLSLRATVIAAQKLVFKKIHKMFGGKIRYVICGGAPLSQETARFFQAIGITILDGYGLTETCAPVTLNTPEQKKIGTVGRPLPDVVIKIAEDGEILIRSRKVFKGYYRSPSETDVVLKDGWLYTGDIGYLDEEGYLHISDRKKDIIITSSGKNIAPQKIESMAQDYPYINQLVVHGNDRNYLTALITLNRDEIIKYASENLILFSDYSELIKNPKIQHLIQSTVDQINAKLASFETIKKFIILPHDFTIESGELTASLKIRRHFVDRKYQSELDNLYDLSY